MDLQGLKAQLRAYGVATRTLKLLPRTQHVLAILAGFTPFRSLIDIGSAEGNIPLNILFDRQTHGLPVNITVYEPAAKHHPALLKIQAGLREGGIATFAVRQARFEDRPAPADVLLCLEVLEHAPDPARLLRACWEHAARAMIVSVPTRPGVCTGYYPPAALEAMADRCGISDRYLIRHRTRLYLVGTKPAPAGGRP